MLSAVRSHLLSGEWKCYSAMVGTCARTFGLQLESRNFATSATLCEAVKRKKKKKVPIASNAHREGTWVLKRMHVLPKEYEPYSVLPPRFEIYDEVAVPESQRSSRLLRVVLLEDVRGLGVRGDLVEVRRDRARDELIALNRAAYATELNLSKYARLGKDTPVSKTRLSRDAYLAMLALQNARLYIDVNTASCDDKWSLAARHVRVALRAEGVFVDDSQITLADAESSDPASHTIRADRTEPFFITLDVRTLRFHQLQFN